MSTVSFAAGDAELYSTVVHFSEMEIPCGMKDEYCKSFTAVGAGLYSTVFRQSQLIALGSLHHCCLRITANTLD